MYAELVLFSFLLGAMAGLLSCFIFRENRTGLVVNIIVGIIGSFIGLWLFKKLGRQISTHYLGYIFSAGIGASILLTLLNLIFKKKYG